MLFEKSLGRVLPNELNLFLPNLIHSDQMGFVKDKYIGQNIRLLNDLMECMDVKKLFGIFLFIDF